MKRPRFRKVYKDQIEKTCTKCKDIFYVNSHQMLKKYCSDICQRDK